MERERERRHIYAQYCIVYRMYISKQACVHVSMYAFVISGAHMYLCGLCMLAHAATGVYRFAALAEVSRCLAREVWEETTQTETRKMTVKLFGPLVAAGAMQVT